MAQLLRTIVIVGSGFCGTVVAANLLRRPPEGPTRIVLIERSSRVARGVAYAERTFPYMLNVPASRMSANSAVPTEFFEFAQRRIPNVTPEDFLPRSLYGDYLEEVLLAAQLSAPRHVRLDIWQAEVTNVRRLERHLPLRVELSDGRVLTADDVVLALGNPPPAMLPGAERVANHRAFAANPWADELKVGADQQLLIIGTGLTMADVVNRVTRNANASPTIHALSRHGLIPPRQTAFRPDAFKGDGNALLLAAATSLARLTRNVRLLAAEAESMGGDWREAITFVRNMAPTIWARLPEGDKKRFLRHLRAYWDIHRHRLPPELVQRMDVLRAAGRLHVHAGRILRIEPRDQQIEVTWRARHHDEVHSKRFDYVINCTGPDYAITRSTDPLWQNLLRSGLCVPDTLSLGLRTGRQGAVVDADGWPGPHLFYVGPMLRADHWEATAVGELRTHAEKLAAQLASRRS